MPQLTLNGTVDDRDERIEKLEADLKRTTAEWGKSIHAIRHMREILTPLYNALRVLFGEMDAVETPPHFPGAHQHAPSTQVWEMWKQRLGGSCAKVIDALLINKDLNTQQLAIATGLNRNTVPSLIMKLNKAGLINKNGGRFSLKQL